MEPQDFIRLVEPHLDVLHRLARRLTRTRADAEDLAQEALVRAFERREALREPERIRGWVLATLRHLHLNKVRDEKPHLLVLTGEIPDDRHGNLDEEIQQHALPDDLLLALRQLPEEQSTAIWLHEVEGLSYEEVALAMETPVGTVRSRLSRARTALLANLSNARKVAGGAA